MQQYIYDDRYRGQVRKLLILGTAGGQEYRVFHETAFMGVLKMEEEDGAPTAWKTEYNLLKPIAAKIGAFIMSENGR